MQVGFGLFVDTSVYLSLPACDASNLTPHKVNRLNLPTPPILNKASLNPDS